jgi:hypothetical protein
VIDYQTVLFGLFQVFEMFVHVRVSAKILIWAFFLLSHLHPVYPLEKLIWTWLFVWIPHSGLVTLSKNEIYLS